MKYRHFISLLTVSTLGLLSSCSSEESEPVDIGLIPIVLTSGNVTRALNAQDTQLATSQTVYVWCKHTGTDNDYFRGWTLTSNGSGGFTGNTVYYPKDGKNIDFYAIHGNITSPTITEQSLSSGVPSSTTAGTALPSSITHQVLADQRTDINYSKSDLLSTKVLNCGPRGHAGGNSYSVNLGFSHLLTRVEVAINTGEDLLPSDVAFVGLMNVKTQTTLSPITFSNATPTVSNTATPIATELKMHPVKTYTSTNGVVAECIIPKQTITGNGSTKVIFIELTDGKRFYYAPTSDLAFTNDATSYRIELVVSKVELTAYKVSWSAWDWTGEGEELGYYWPEIMSNMQGTVDSNDPDSQSLEWEYGSTGAGAEKQGGEWFP